MQTSDTLFLSSKDFKVILSNDYILDIEVINNKTISLVKNIKYSVIIIEYQDKLNVAKGIDILSSIVPKDSDYFYPLDKGHIYIINNRISFRKVVTTQ